MSMDIVEVSKVFLNDFSLKHPGNSVEIRIPGVGVISCIEGVKHRRGNPPNVVEMGMESWLELNSKVKKWNDLVDEGKLYHSGYMSDLSKYFE